MKCAVLAVMTACVAVVAANPWPRPEGFKGAAAGPVESHAAADASFRSKQFINRFNAQQMNQAMARGRPDS